MTNQHSLLIPRRRLLAWAGSAPLQGLLAGCASGLAIDEQPPIVFVHGNGDSSALWTTTLWRWQSNGWPRERLHAVDFPYPSSRDDDTVPQVGRSSSEDATRTLASEVEKALASTGARQVVLIGNSRGGNAIRSYIAYAGGAAKVSHAILGGTPNHGVWADPAFRPNNEFNGAGPFLSRLNNQQGVGGDEITPGPRWMTLRSDHNDKYAQPDGVWIGASGKPTNVTSEGPALRGANNVVLPSRDHREVSYHPEAFAAAFRFVTGRSPTTRSPLHIAPEPVITLSGQLSGVTAAGPTNLPAPGGRVAVHAVDPITGLRLGPPLFDGATAADGTWGPIHTDSRTPLEFVVQATGFAVAHVYRSPFPRSSNLVHFRPERMTDADVAAAAVVTFTRPRAYFGLPRDTVVLDGAPAPGIPAGVAGVAVSQRRYESLDPPQGRTVVGEFSSGVLSERVVGRLWPARENQLTVLELHD
jgi:pimeloyl-ACP methyl ester carboxylesterase